MPEIFFENISTNIIVTEKMIMTNILGNFVADNIVFGMEVQAPPGFFIFNSFSRILGKFKTYNTKQINNLLSLLDIPCVG